VHRRIDRIKGRSDDMLIIKGVNIFPMQVERVLMDIPEVGTNYRIVLEQVDGLDSMKVQVEVHSETFKEDMRHLRRLQEKITHDLHNELLITPRVELVQPNSLPQAEGKAVRVVDDRPRSGPPASS
jgi:phenylacetate-CoA ligase